VAIEPAKWRRWQSGLTISLLARLHPANGTEAYVDSQRSVHLPARLSLMILAFLPPLVRGIGYWSRRGAEFGRYASEFQIALAADAERGIRPPASSDGAAPGRARSRLVKAQRLFAIQHDDAFEIAWCAAGNTCRQKRAFRPTPSKSGAGIGHVGRDAHFRHDPYKALADSMMQ